MLYLANPSSEAIRDAMRSGVIGLIDTPLQRNTRPPGVTWCADNGCFGSKYPGDAAWFAWLTRHAPDAGTCLFATAPDVVGDAEATLVRSAPWLPRIRALGYPAAFVAQDGLEDLVIPWDEFDVLFIGGSTEWKLGAAARAIVRQARDRGKWVHCGRVNSGRRYALMKAIGCQSADGTFLTYAPDLNLERMKKWFQPDQFALEIEGAW